jgi:hypothetical protein
MERRRGMAAFPAPLGVRKPVGHHFEEHRRAHRQQYQKPLELKYEAKVKRFRREA